MNVRPVSPQTEAQVLYEFGRLRALERAGVPRGEIVEHGALSLADSRSANAFTERANGNAISPSPSEPRGMVGAGFLGIVGRLRTEDLLQLVAHASGVLADRTDIPTTAGTLERIAAALLMIGKGAREE